MVGPLLSPPGEENSSDKARSLVFSASSPYVDSSLDFNTSNEGFKFVPKYGSFTEVQRHPCRSSRDFSNARALSTPVEPFDDDPDVVISLLQSRYLMPRQPSRVHRVDEIEDVLEFDPDAHRSLWSIPHEHYVSKLERRDFVGHPQFIEMGSQVGAAHSRVETDH